MYAQPSYSEIRCLPLRNLGIEPMTAMALTQAGSKAAPGIISGIKKLFGGNPNCGKGCHPGESGIAGLKSASPGREWRSSVTFASLKRFWDQMAQDLGVSPSVVGGDLLKPTPPHPHGFTGVNGGSVKAAVAKLEQAAGVSPGTVNFDPGGDYGMSFTNAQVLLFQIDEMFDALAATVPVQGPPPPPAPAQPAVLPAAGPLPTDPYAGWGPPQYGPRPPAPPPGPAMAGMGMNGMMPMLMIGGAILAVVLSIQPPARR